MHCKLQYCIREKFCSEILRSTLLHTFLCGQVLCSSYETSTATRSVHSFVLFKLVHPWMEQTPSRWPNPILRKMNMLLRHVTQPKTEQDHSEGRYCLPENIGPLTSLAVTCQFRTNRQLLGISSEVERPSKVTVPPTRGETVTSQIPARRGACSHVSGFESGSYNKLGILRIV